MDADEYRQRLNALEEQLAAVYRERRQLTESFAQEHPAVLPPARFQTDVQQRVARCPRCSARLDSDVSGAKICADPDCSLPDGHDGFHVPLPVLWQEAGYADGPWKR